MRYLSISILLIALLFSAQTIHAQAPAITWQKCLGGGKDDEASCIRQTNDGGYIVASTTNSIDGDVTGNHGGFDAWIVKISNTGAIQWEKCIGGSNNEYVNSIQQTTDGGYIFVGSTNSNNGDITDTTVSIDGDYWVIKLNDTGRIEWQKTFSFYGTSATCVQQTADGGYIVGGNGSSYMTNELLKLDNTGTLQWQKDLSNQFQLAGAMQTNDGNYIVCGYGSVDSGYYGGYFDCILMKLNDTGAVIWEKNYGGSNQEKAFAITQAIDGGYVFAGYTASTDGDITDSLGGTDVWLVEVDTAGIIQWQKSYGGSEDDIALAIQPALGNGYIIAGFTESNDKDVTGFHGGGALGYGDMWVVKTDDTGKLQWQKCLGGSKDDLGNSICISSDGGYVIAGTTFSVDGDVTGAHGNSASFYDDTWVVKLGGTTGITNVTPVADIIIYPNPAHDILNIATTGNISSELTTIDGKVVIGRCNKTQINISGLPIGTYLLNVYNAYNVLLKTDKVVKE